jgi:thiamine-monophosphate kinase
MLDVSDGLLADLGHIADASGVAIDLMRDAFEVPPPLPDVSAALGVDPYAWILGGGDDHALVATFPPIAVLSDQWRVIGHVLSDGTAPIGVTVDGEAFTGVAAGWDHFRSPPPR